MGRWGGPGNRRLLLAGAALLLAAGVGVGVYVGNARQRAVTTAGPALPRTATPSDSLSALPVGPPPLELPRQPAAPASPQPPELAQGPQWPEPQPAPPLSPAPAPAPPPLPPGPRPPAIPPLPGTGGRPPAPAPRARLALVIDDFGYGWEAADAFLSLRIPLSVAVLPHLPHSREQARRAAAAGFDVLLHLPMEPEGDGVPVTPDTIGPETPPAEMDRRVAAALDQFPGLVGVSNHEGSRATADEAVMERVLAAVADRRLFFLDSRTSQRSVARQVGEQLGVPVLENSLFLDNDPDPEAVKARIRQAMRLALRRGTAIAIGHVRPGTFQAILEMIPEIEGAGVELVRLSDLLAPPVGSRGGEAGVPRAEPGPRLEER